MTQIIDLESGELRDIEQAAPQLSPPEIPEASSTQIIDLEGDGQLIPINQQEIAQLATETAQEEEAGTAVGNFIRSIDSLKWLNAPMVIASSMVAEPVAGLEGAARAIASPITGEKATDIASEIDKTRNALTFDTQDPGSQRMLRMLGALMEQGIDLASLPLEGLQGLATTIGTMDPLLADQAIDEMREKGVSQFLGDEILRTTGSDLAAAGTTTLPTALASLFGVKTKPRVPAGNAAKSVVDAGKQAGIDVLTTDIAPPTTAVGRLSQQLAERVPFVGTGGKRGQQRQQRIDAIQAIEDATPAVEASDIFSSLQKNVQKEKRAAGKTLEEFRQRLSGGDLPDQSVIDDIRNTAEDPELPPQIRDEAVAEFEVLERLADGPGSENALKAMDEAIEQLSKPGKLKTEGFVESLREMIGDFDIAGENFEDLRTLRTDFRAKIVDKVDEAGRSQLSSNEKRLMDNVLRGITKDLDDFARDVLSPDDFARYKKADKVYAEEARKLTKSRLKTVLDKGDVQPELVENLLFSSRPSEVRLLYNKLGESGRENARNAIMGRALKNSTAKGEISVEKFLTQLDKLESQFSTFYRGDARRELKGLRKVLQATRRADAAGVITPTGQQLLAPLAAMMTGASFFSPTIAAGTATVGTVGLIGRLYESSLVRNRLIRAANASKEEVIDIARELPVLMAAAQQQQEEIEE